jgi:hypothetical protein
MKCNGELERERDKLQAEIEGEFLAHLRWSYAIMWHPASISRARFVTTWAIDQKRWTYVPLGKSNSQTKFRSSLVLGLATRGQNQKHKKCYKYVCPWISVEKIILTLTNFFISFFSSDFSRKILKSKMAAEVTWPPLSQKNSKRIFFHLAISIIYAMQVKKVW